MDDRPSGGHRLAGWINLAVLAGVTSMAFLAAGLSVAVNRQVLGLAALGAALAATICYTRPRVPQLALAADALLNTLVMLTATALLQYAAAVPALPYIDRSLAAADAMIGFDWLAFHRWTWDHPLVAEAQTYAYTLLLPQLFPGLVILAFWNARAVGRFLTANFIVMTVTIIVSAVIPAAGAMAWFHPASTPITPDSYPVQLDLVRSGVLRALDTRSIVGLIQFPSYHAALAVLVGLAFSGTPKWLAIPVWLLELAIIISAPVMGGHFGVDILAGAVLALAVHFVVVNQPQPGSSGHPAT